MKLIGSISSIVALSLGLSTGAFAAEKKTATKEGTAPSAEAKKTDAKSAPEAKKSDAKPADAAGKPLPMSSRVDSIDASGKSFTHKNKDGKETKFVVTDKTEIKNGGAAAKFSDIKVGDTVSGSRIKKSDTEWEIVKITKFGAAAPKKEKEGAKPAEKKPEEKKQ